MIDSKEIRERLAAEYRGGKTYQQMGERYGLSYAYLRDLILGNVDADGLTIRKLNSLFPAAKLSLDGSVIADNSGTVNGVIGINNGTVNADGEAFRSRAIDALLESDLPPEYALRSIKIIKNL